MRGPSLALDGPPFTVTDRLPFTLPDFTRHSWVDDAARQTWEPRLDRIRLAWADIEWLSIRDGVRACALVGLSQSALEASIPRWYACGLSAVGLSLSAPESHPGIIFAVIGDLDDASRGRDAWVAGDDDALGALFGYPECCRKFFHEVWVERRCIDTTWAMASNTKRPSDALVALESSEGHLANILWRWLGVRAVPHLPCRFDCPESVRFAERMLQVGKAGGYGEEVKWIHEILSWPVEWSALHGIAEVKTPILKISTRTDATAGKYVVRWAGTAYPAEGATGLRFPYRAPTRPLMTEGPSFQLGLKKLLEEPRPDRSWYHLDNGFSSAETMNELHQPIVALARRALHELTGDVFRGNVLDLGCGNGALLAKICDGQSGLTPYGVDLNRKSLEHAATLLPSFASNFSAADLFDCDAWRRERRYALTLLMAGRLLEVERPIAERLLKTLRAQSDAILVYSYPGVGGRSLEAVAREMGFSLDSMPDAIAGLVTNAEASRVGEGLSLAGARPAATAQPLPDIDTSTNVIVLDRAVEILSTFASPRIVLMGNVLSAEECDALVEHCASNLARSQVIADAQGNLQRHENRTSRDAMLRRGETAIVARVEARLAALARWPVECGEGLQVVRYDPGEEYRPHCDWIDPGVEGLREHLDPGGQRLGTFLLYLSDVASGGDTAFPTIGLRIKPRKGAAVFFQNTDAHYAPDRSSLHAGCPVIQGVKWVANKWLRQRVC